MFACTAIAVCSPDTRIMGESGKLFMHSLCTFHEVKSVLSAHKFYLSGHVICHKEFLYERCTLKFVK